MLRVRKVLITLCACAPMSLPAPGGEAARTAAADESAQVNRQRAEFFEKKIRPVLVERCQECHSGDEPESGLSLESRAGLLQGGKLGSALIPGQPAQSLLIRAIKHDEFVKMPPKEKLPTRQVIDLTRWVEMGAPWPDSTPTGTTRQGPGPPEPGRQFTRRHRAHWAFQPVSEPALPEVESDWPQSAIDQFILAQRSAAHENLKPAGPADRRTLIRRATFDLTGLPPTPAEVDAFLRDDSPLAFSRLVDRLLASPRYGERWGRHWLDVARYADSNGLDENLSYANAFRYRDYVIAALNGDKPYARFVEEQIAGDLLPTPDDQQQNRDRYIATGFLAIGPKMLAEDDPVKMQMDIIDEQLSTLGQAFMALTIGCARCHDHKFDPLPTEDYYSLAGIFKSSKTMENHNVVAVWYERPLASSAATAEMERIDKQISEVSDRLDQLKSAPSGEDEQDADRMRQRKELGERLKKLKSSRPVPDLAMGVTEGSPQDLRVHLRGSHIALGKLAARRLPRILAGEEQPSFGDRQSGRLQLARWLSSRDHPLVGRVLVNRVWNWHFGRGISPTVDNFGSLGRPPTHPRLLDWLTNRFLAGGGSIKQLHRQMMLSGTYQMSTQYDERAARLDPENAYLWRFRRRRLSAEEMRDSLIAVGAGLDFAMGGSLLKVKNRAYVTGSGTNLTDEFDSRRRSVYLPVVRSAVYDVLKTFDFPDPAVAVGARQTSTVAPQALMLMNSQLADQQMRALARRLLRLATVRQRLEAAFELVLNRKPDDAERQAGRQFLREARQVSLALDPDAKAADLRAWQSYCRVLLSSNEFAYVE